MSGTDPMGATDHVVLQAAILHDTIEDTEATPDEIEERFGTVLAEGRSVLAGDGLPGAGSSHS